MGRPQTCIQGKQIQRKLRASKKNPLCGNQADKT